MLINIIIFFLLLLLLILLSINISLFGQTKKSWKGGGGLNLANIPPPLLHNGLIKLVENDSKYINESYPVFLQKNNESINLNIILKIFTKINRPDSYAMINMRELIYPNNNFDIDTIRELWEHIPVTALSSKSLVIFNGKSINIYYIGSIYYMQLLSNIYYIDMITLLLLEANRRAHLENKYAYIIVEPLFYSENILLLYHTAIANSICDKIHSINIYLTNQYVRDKYIINKVGKQILLHIEDRPIMADNIQLLTTLSTKIKSFYSKNIIVRHYINNGISSSGNLYWAPKSSYNSKMLDSKYFSELNAANNSLIPFLQNPIINTKYIDNIKYRSIAFNEENGSIDWQLSYDTIQYIQNKELIIENSEYLLSIFDILLEISFNISIVEQIITYNNFVSEFNIYFNIQPFCKIEYYKVITENLFHLCKYMTDNNLTELYNIFGNFFKKKKNPKYKEFENILKTKYPEHEKRVMRYLIVVNYMIFKAKDKHHEEFIKDRQMLIDMYKDYANIIFNIFNSLIDFFEKWKNIKLIYFLYTFFIKLKNIVSLFKEDNEKVLFIMPYLLLWGIWPIDNDICNNLFDLLKDHIGIFKNIYTIYLLVFRIQLLPNAETGDDNGDDDNGDDDNDDDKRILTWTNIYFSNFGHFTNNHGDKYNSQIIKFFNLRDDLKQIIQSSKYYTIKKEGGSKLKIELAKLDTNRIYLLDNIGKNKKLFNDECDNFFKNIDDTKDKLLIVRDKKQIYDELKNNILEYIFKPIEYIKELKLYEKYLNDKIIEEDIQMYKEIEQLQEREREQEKEQLKELAKAREQENANEQEDGQEKNKLIDMLKDIQSNKKESSIYVDNYNSNSYKDKLLTLFEWFSNVSNNNIILILNIGNIQKLAFGINAIYFLPIIPAEEYLYNGKLYSIGDIISIDALKNIPNGTYYYKGAELHFD
jgi:hypothetical protein